MTTILKADVIVAERQNHLSNLCTELKANGVTPCLKVILVGANPASIIYTRNKKKFCEKIGASCEIIHLAENTSEKEFLDNLRQHANDKKVHGLFVQLPLPLQLEKVQFSQIIPCTKDVDGFHPLNLSALIESNNNTNHLLPCTPSGILKLLAFYKISTSGKNIVIVGRSLIVGKPLALMLTNQDATVTIAHSKTNDLKSLTKSADIVIAAIGKAHFLNKDFFRNDKKQIVIDVGINKIGDKIAGDVDFESVMPLVSAITPVPGGVGPLTILCLMENLIKAAQLNKE